MCSNHKHSSTGNSDLVKVIYQGLGELALSTHKATSHHHREDTNCHEILQCDSYWEFPIPVQSQLDYAQSNGARKFSPPMKKKEGFWVSGDIGPRAEAKVGKKLYLYLTLEQFTTVPKWHKPRAMCLLDQLTSHLCHSATANLVQLDLCAELKV